MLNYVNTTTILQILQAVVDIICTWFVLYFVLKVVRNNSRTIQIFKGIIFVIIVQAIAKVLQLKTIEYLAGMFITWGPLALIIIFTPEIRNMLEKIGKTNLFSRISTLTVNERETLVNELVKASVELSNTQTGALISLEQGHSLSDFIKTGTRMNSIVTSELLCSIFVPGTPLHDGAVIIQGDKIACASAYFPPTTIDFPSSYGARHRAAIGISEITDSISIVISEETGTISIAEGGKLLVANEEKLREYLMRVICHVENEVASSKQIADKSMDEVEFENGKENEAHKGPKITAHLMRKNSKKYKKHKVEELSEEVKEKTKKSSEEITAEIKQEVKSEKRRAPEEAVEIVYEANGEDGETHAKK